MGWGLPPSRSKAAVCSVFGSGLTCFCLHWFESGSGFGVVLKKDLVKVDCRTIEWCSNPRAALDSLAAPLASYLMSSQALAQVGLRQPDPFSHPGTINGLFVRSEEMGAGPGSVIASAFLLPFTWVKGTMDGEGVPKGVLEVAEQVREVTGRKEFGLQLGRDLRSYDMSGLVLRAESLWVALAAQLEITALGGLARTRVLATGSWDGRVSAVEGVGRKVELVRKISSGMKEGPLLFVPGANEEEARSAAADEVDIRTYPPMERDWRKSLSEHLRMLDTPPVKSESTLEKRLEYANRPHVMTDAVYRREYYLDQIVDDLAAQVGAWHGKAEHRGGRKLRRLIVPVSYRYELAVLLLKALRPASALLLCTPQSMEHGFKVRAAAEGDVRDIELILVEKGDEEKLLGSCVEWLMAEPDESVRAVEITSGTKVVSAALVAAALRANAKIFYLDHEVSDKEKAGPLPFCGNEKLRRLDWIENREAQGGSS